MSWGIYKNGNSTVRINLEDGTKIRETNDDEFNLEFPESIDLSIGTRCDGHCPFCYINASEDGEDGELLDVPFLDTLHPYTEVAINGNSIDHPQLIPFLEKMKQNRILTNITVNQLHFERKEELIRDLVEHDLVKGIGISLRKPTEEFIRKVLEYPNAVIHTINGILTAEDIDMMKNNDLKILVLGYKNLGRGVSYKDNCLADVERNQKYLYNILPMMIEWFKVVSFDNLAIEQLDVRRIISKEDWDSFYMGDEGTASMFVDLVTRQFGVSSLCKPDEMYPIMDNVRDMFKVVKEEVKK